VTVSLGGEDEDVLQCQHYPLVSCQVGPSDLSSSTGTGTYLEEGLLVVQDLLDPIDQLHYFLPAQSIWKLT